MLIAIGALVIVVLIFVIADLEEKRKENDRLIEEFKRISRRENGDD